MASSRDPEDQPPRATHGPRGGRTTRSASGMVKKNLWLTPSLAAALRRSARASGLTEAEIFRRALACWLRRLGR